MSLGTRLILCLEIKEEAASSGSESDEFDTAIVRCAGRDNELVQFDIASKDYKRLKLLYKPDTEMKLSLFSEISLSASL